MRDWRYRTQELAREAGRRLRDHARVVALGGALALVVLLYAVFFLDPPFATSEMIILHRREPRWNTIVVSLDGDYPVRTIEVVSLDPDGRAGETVWKVRRTDTADPLSAFAYAQPIPGMEVVAGPAALEEGASYRLLVRAPGARGEAEFVFEPVDPDAPRAGRRRGP